jgi:hypothetical protein
MYLQQKREPLFNIAHGACDPDKSRRVRTYPGPCEATLRTLLIGGVNGTRTRPAQGTPRLRGGRLTRMGGNLAKRDFG